MPCGQAHRTGSQASRRPTSTALCGAPHIVRLHLHRPDVCELIMFVTLPNATTARDLSPSRPARKSAHRNVASTQPPPAATHK
eukprot:scaffold427_cov43-Phaeocystis_antarctica.AAC.1